MSARLTRSRICSTYAVRNAWTVARRYRATRSLETSAIPDNGSTNTARHTSHVTIFDFPPNCPSISLLLHDTSFFIAQDVHLERQLGEGHATTIPTGGEPSDRYPWRTVCLAICPHPQAAVFPTRKSLSRAKDLWLTIPFFRAVRPVRERSNLLDRP